MMVFKNVFAYMFYILLQQKDSSNYNLFITLEYCIVIIFRHYAVIKSDEKFYVECEKKRKFSSLNDLVLFYALNKNFVGKDGCKQRFPGT